MSYVSTYAAIKLSRHSKSFSDFLYRYCGKVKSMKDSFILITDIAKFSPNEIVKAPATMEVWDYFYRQCGIHIYTNEVDGGFKVGVDTADGVRVNQHYMKDVYESKEEAVNAAIDYVLQTQMFY